MNNILAIKSVVYSYKVKTGNNVNVIRHATGEFEKANMYAVLGGKGAGKTTLLKLAAGMDKVDSGVIEYKGQNINELDSYEYRSKTVGCFFEEFGLFDNYTSIDNVILQMQINNKESVKLNEKAKELLNRVELEQEKRYVKASKLNGLDKKKVGLARALATEAEIILVDDIDLNVTKNEANGLLEIMQSLAKDDNLCIIFTTSSTDFTSLADGVMTFNRGTAILKKE